MLIMNTLYLQAQSARGWLTTLPTTSAQTLAVPYLYKAVTPCLCYKKTKSEKFRSTGRRKYNLGSDLENGKIITTWSLVVDVSGGGFVLCPGEKN